MTDPSRATCLSKWSEHLSCFGLVIGVIMACTLCIVLPIVLTDTDHDVCYYTYYKGWCYKYKTYVGYSGSCNNGIKADSYCYSDSCSYYEYGYKCYKYRTYVGNYACTHGFTSATGYCYSATCHYYEYNDTCYRYRKYIDSWGYCIGVRSPDNYCYNYCPEDMYMTSLGSCYKKTNWKKYVGSLHACIGVRSGGIIVTTLQRIRKMDRRSLEVYYMYTSHNFECLSIIIHQLHKLQTTQHICYKLAIW